MLLDDLQTRERELQTRATTAEDQLNTPHGKHRKLEKDFKDTRTAWGSKRVIVVADEKAGDVCAEKHKASIVKLEAELGETRS